MQLLEPETMLALQVGLTTGIAAFTAKQRLSIRQRDNESCQFPEHLNGHSHECKGRLEVHHILPQRYAKEIGFDPDFPENAITLCQEAHQQVHPDMKTARKRYRMDRKSYQKAFQAREENLKEKRIYWDDSWDRPMTAMAVRNTQKAKRQGWEFPE